MQCSAVQDYIESVYALSRVEGLFPVFDLKNYFPNEWYAANHPVAGATERVLIVDKLNEKLPIFTKGREPKNIWMKNSYLFVSSSVGDAQDKKVPTELPPFAITATQSGLSFPLSPGEKLGTAMTSFVANDVEAPMDSLKIQIQDTKLEIDEMWLLERYVLA